MKATSSNCGKFLKVITTTFHLVINVKNQDNDLGHSKNVIIWIIRIQLLVVFIYEYITRKRFRD